MTIDQMEQTIHGLTVERDGLKQELEQLKGKPVAEEMAKDFDEVIKTLRDDLSSTQDKLVSTENELAKLVTENADLKSKLEMKDLTIADLRAKQPPLAVSVPPPTQD